MTTKIPTKAGYYWWTDFGEDTPCILWVEKSGGKLYASNEEYSFIVKKERNSLWSEAISLPIIYGEVMEPSSF